MSIFPNQNNFSLWTIPQQIKWIMATLRVLFKLVGQGSTIARVQTMAEVAGLNLQNGQQVYVAETDATYMQLASGLNLVTTSPLS